MPERLCRACKEGDVLQLKRFFEQCGDRYDFISPSFFDLLKSTQNRELLLLFKKHLCIYRDLPKEILLLLFEGRPEAMEAIRLFQEPLLLLNAATALPLAWGRPSGEQVPLQLNLERALEEQVFAPVREKQWIREKEILSILEQDSGNDKQLQTSVQKFIEDLDDIDESIEILWFLFLMLIERDAFSLATGVFTQGAQVKIYPSLLWGYLDAEIDFFYNELVHWQFFPEVIPPEEIESIWAQRYPTAGSWEEENHCLFTSTYLIQLCPALINLVSAYREMLLTPLDMAIQFKHPVAIQHLRARGAKTYAEVKAEAEQKLTQVIQEIWG